MALDYFYDPKEQIIRIVGHGTVSIEDRINLVKNLLSAPDLPPHAAILIDVNKVANMPTPEDIGIIALLIEKMQSRLHGRVAILNTKAGHVTASHLTAFKVGDGVNQVKVCAFEAEALDWLRS